MKTDAHDVKIVGSEQTRLQGELSVPTSSGPTSRTPLST